MLSAAAVSNAGVVVWLAGLLREVEVEVELDAIDVAETEGATLGVSAVADVLFSGVDGVSVVEIENEPLGVVAIDGDDVTVAMELCVEDVSVAVSKSLIGGFPGPLPTAGTIPTSLLCVELVAADEAVNGLRDVVTGTTVSAAEPAAS